MLICRGDEHAFAVGEVKLEVSSAALARITEYMNHYHGAPQKQGTFPVPLAHTHFYYIVFRADKDPPVLQKPLRDPSMPLVPKWEWDFLSRMSNALLIDVTKVRWWYCRSCC